MAAVHSEKATDLVVRGSVGIHREAQNDDYARLFVRAQSLCRSEAGAAAAHI